MKLRFDSMSSIPSGARATLVAQPKAPFAGVRFACDDTVALCFMLEGIKVGPDEQMAPEALPLPFLQMRHAEMQIKLATCPPDRQIVIVVQNASRMPVRFVADLVDASERPPA